MSAENSIQLFQALFYVSLGMAVLGLGLAVLFFFIYDIPTVYAFLTGKAKKETIERMAQQNAKTGKLRHNFESGELGRSGKLGKTGRLGQSEKFGQSGQLGNQAVQSYATTEGLGGYQQPAQGYTEPVTETAVLAQEPQTTVLQHEAETSVLGQEPLTTVLQQEQPLTTVLRQEAPAASAQTVRQKTVELAGGDPGQTAILTGSQPVGIRFDLTENTTVIHTDEVL